MLRIQLATNATVAVMIFALQAGAQSSMSGVQYYAAAGVARAVQRDLSASPLNFSGYGFNAVLGLEHVSGSSVLDASLDGGMRSLASSSGANPRERLLSGAMSMSLLHRFGARDSRDGLALGAQLSGVANLNTHSYDDPSRRSADFVLNLASLAPVIEWRHAMFGGATIVQASVPVASVVAHSYSVVNEQDLATQWRTAFPNSLRALDGSLRYSTSASRRMGLVYIYRVRALRYDGVESVRTVSQSLSLGGVVRAR